MVHIASRVGLRFNAKLLECMIDENTVSYWLGLTVSLSPSVIFVPGPDTTFWRSE